MATSLPITRYALDPTGVNPDNAVHGEVHTLITGRPVRAICMQYGSFFSESVVIIDTLTSSLLIPTIDYQIVELNQSASALYAKEICVVVLITNPSVTQVTVDYQALGGPYERNSQTLVDVMNNLMVDDRPVHWPDILGKPERFLPSMHLHDIGDTYGWEFVCYALERIRQAILLSDSPAMESVLKYIDESLEALRDEFSLGGDALAVHKADKNNPHETTKAHVGLSYIENLQSLTDGLMASFLPREPNANQLPALKDVNRYVTSKALFTYHDKILPALTLQKRDGTPLPGNSMVYTDPSEIISPLIGNKLRLMYNQLYYGVKPHPTQSDLFVDPVNGIDTLPSSPDYETKAGLSGTVSTSAWPFRTVKAALDKGASGVWRNIYLKEGEEHVVQGTDTVARGGTISFGTYGPISGPTGAVGIVNPAIRALNTRLTFRCYLTTTGSVTVQNNSFITTIGKTILDFSAIRIIGLQLVDPLVAMGTPYLKSFQEEKSVETDSFEIQFRNSTYDFGDIATAIAPSGYSYLHFEIMSGKILRLGGSTLVNNNRLVWLESKVENESPGKTFLFIDSEPGFEFKFQGNGSNVVETDLYNLVGPMRKTTMALPNLTTNVLPQFFNAAYEAYGNPHNEGYHAGEIIISSIDNSITLMGIVPALKLKVGDVIQPDVEGELSYDTKVFTVDEIVSSNKIIVNKLHLTSTPVGSLVLNSASGKGGVSLITRWHSAGLGIGQKEIDLTASRVPGDIYTNTNNRSIMVTASLVGPNSNYTATYTVGGITHQWSHAGVGIGIVDSVTFVVPAGSTYSCNNFQKLTELR